ncbi:tellurite resistance/C4-dicarboxylate transporter family protein [Kocuria marina]|uniref:tellurite resistance/C4-dicarboxylate transporter family protein n=1 Tax=Kocuria marina TaxID=223184 RepID=UPI0022DED4FD|nr:tellurite resistance/C4-dicarboxylate transporter family protein [Kocuria marina]
MSGTATTTRISGRALGALKRNVASLPPSCFAVVMASGIVSVGAYQLGFHGPAQVVMGFALAVYAVLVVLTAWRVIAYPQRVLEDLHVPARAFGFFTGVAGTNVVAVCLIALGETVPAALLLAASGVGWLLLGYVVPWFAVLGRAERPVLALTNGSWFIWVVAAQSMAVVSATLEPLYPQARQVLSVTAVMCWSIGLVLYCACAVFLSLRLLVYPLTPETIDAPYWVAMGSLAISVVAGALIVEMDSAPMVDATRGLVGGMAVVLWCFATWLIPVLVALGVWRHAVKRVPLRYDASLWSIVFPLGMYAVAGMYLGRANHLPLLTEVGRWFYWVAAAAWVLTLAAMLGRGARGVFARGRG